jgi:hypothetical protein
MWNNISVAGWLKVAVVRSVKLVAEAENISGTSIKGNFER